MHRPSAIASRWRWELAKLDIVGGAVIAVIIVVSFLSLMSFAEFLRFQWGGAQQQPQRQRLGDRRGNVGNGANNREGGRMDIIEGEIDEIDTHLDRDVDGDPLAPFLNHLMANDDYSVENYDYSSDSMNDDGRRARRRRDLNGGLDMDEKRGPMDDGIDESNDETLQPRHMFESEENDFEMFMRAQEEQAMMDEQHPNDMPGDNHLLQNDPPGMVNNDEHNMPDVIQQPQQPLRNDVNPRQRDNARFEPQFEPLQPAFADNDALDEGPVSNYLFSSPPISPLDDLNIR